MVNIKKNPLEANKLRVLVVPPSYIEGNRTIGGGERYALEYSHALSQLAFVTLGLLGDSERTEKDGHLEIRVFKNAGYSSAWPFALLSPNAKQFLEYDLIHVMVFPTPLTDFLILLSLIYGKKVAKAKQLFKKFFLNTANLSIYFIIFYSPYFIKTIKIF